MGLSSLYLSVISFLHNTSNLGIPFSSIKEISELYGQDRTEDVLRQVEVVRTWGVWTGLAGMLLCLLFSPVISYWAFDDTSHILPLCLLSPVMAFMGVTAGEFSILKAVRRLKRVALVSVLGAVATLLLTVPFYYLWGMWGVVPALVFSTLGVMVAHLSLSLPVFPWRVNLLSRSHFHKGWSMVRVGVPYIMATAVNMSVAMGISLFITNWGSLSDVGLYGMGYNLVITYAGVVFTAVDADYFPRLSSVNADVGRMNQTINRQIKVCVLLMSPFLVLFMICMPLAIRVLYSSSFLPMTGMAVCASMHMFFKSMTLPVAYTSLAKGDAVMIFVHGGGLRHLYGRVRDCRFCIRRYFGYGNRLGFGRSVRLVDDLCCVRATLRLQARQGGTSVHGSTVPLRGGSFVFGHAVRSMAQGCSRRMRIRCQCVAFGFGDS